MTTGKKTFARRAVAGLGVASLGVVGLAATATAGIVPPTEPEVPLIGNIDPEMDGESSLTIHKYDGTEGTAGNGKEIETPAGATPLGGVEFTLWQLGIPGDDDACTAIDLKTYEDWALVPGNGDTDGLAPATLEGVEAEGFCIVDPQVGHSRETDEGGSLTFGNLDLSLYYVQETSADGAYKMVDGERVPVSVVGESLPFYVAIPMPVEGEWIYDVHVYPKNQLGEAPSKTVNSEGLVVGDDVVWTITGTAPTPAGDFTEASIWDDFDSRLNYESSKLTVDGEVVYDDSEGAAAIEPELVTYSDGEWTFNTAGLTWLNSHKGKAISLEITTTVDQDFEDGVIPNDDYGFSFNDREIPGPPTPYTYVGGLKVTKTDNSQPAKALKGAVFELTKAPESGVCPAMNLTGDVRVPAVADVVSTGTSGDNGVVMWTPPTPASDVLGLWIADSDNGPIEPTPSKDYCLYETVVPAGYTGASVAKVTIKPGQPTVVNGTDMTVVNAQTEGPGLPNTGSNGTIVMSIAGLALIGVGAGTVLIARNRRGRNAA